MAQTNNRTEEETRLVQKPKQSEIKRQGEGERERETDSKKGRENYTMRD